MFCYFLQCIATIYVDVERPIFGLTCPGGKVATANGKPHEMCTLNTVHSTVRLCTVLQRMVKRALRPQPWVRCTIILILVRKNFVRLVQYRETWKINLFYIENAVIPPFGHMNTSRLMLNSELGFINIL